MTPTGERGRTHAGKDDKAEMGSEEKATAGQPSLPVSQPAPSAKLQCLLDGTGNETKLRDDASPSHRGRVLMKEWINAAMEKTQRELENRCNTKRFPEAFFLSNKMSVSGGHCGP